MTSLTNPHYHRHHENLSKLLNNCQQHTHMHDLGAIITSKKEQNQTLRGSVLWLKQKGYFSKQQKQKKKKNQSTEIFSSTNKDSFILSALGSLPARGTTVMYSNFMK